MTLKPVVRQRRHKLAIALLIMLALVAAACGNDDDSPTAASADSAEEFDAASDEGNRALTADAVTASDAPVPAEEEPAAETQAQGAGSESTNQAEATQPSPLAEGRSIVFVANLAVTVDDVALAASQAKTQMAGLGGLLFGENTETGDRDRTVLQFKVLPEDFQEALARLEGLGRLDSQQISADDVTERVVNLQSRIATSEVSVDRLRELLIGASELEAIAGLEGQLLQRETDLEVLRGQLRTLQDQVSLATIFLTLNETAPPEINAIAEFEVTFYNDNDRGERCPGQDELTVDEGDDLTICVQITNVGNAELTEIELRDDRLRLRPRDFTFIGTDEDVILSTDQQVFAWATIEAPADGSAFIELSAVAVDDNGDSLRVRTEFDLVADYSLDFVQDDSLPGFVDALSGSWDFFKTLVGLLILLAGALVPFIWVPFVIWFLRGVWVRRQERLNVAEDEQVRTKKPPPLPAPPAKNADG